jgi:hypothetical protein
MIGMDEMIRQIRAASAAGLFYLALFGALTLPDICGALASSDGKATGTKYKTWLRDYVPEQANNADLVYGLRCSLLHQGRTLPHGGTYPIASVAPAPGRGEIHNLSTVVDGKQVGWLSISMFVDEMTRGAEAWFERFGDSETVIRNFEKFARIRPDGLPPHVAGVSVIA